MMMKTLWTPVALSCRRPIALLSRSFAGPAAAFLALIAGVVLPLGGTAQAREGTTPDTARVLVEGEVVDEESGRPIAGARVSLTATAGLRLGPSETDRDGAFRFASVPVGVYRLTVNADGYDSMEDSLPVGDGQAIRFVLPLSRVGGSQEPRAVATDPGVEGARDYRGRRRRGGSGFLVTREDILDRRPRYVSEMLARVPGGMLLPNGGGGYTLLLRNQCQPGAWVDGVRVGTGSPDPYVAPNEVEALEVYHGFELPVEFGVDRCGGILVWTRRGVEIPPPGGAVPDDAQAPQRRFLGRLIQVALVVVAVLTLTR